MQRSFWCGGVDGFLGEGNGVAAWVAGDTRKAPAKPAKFFANIVIFSREREAMAENRCKYVELRSGLALCRSAKIRSAGQRSRRRRDFPAARSFSSQPGGFSRACAWNTRARRGNSPASGSPERAARGRDRPTRRINPPTRGKNLPARGRNPLARGNDRAARAHKRVARRDNSIARSSDSTARLENRAARRLDSSARPDNRAARRDDS